MTYLQRLNPGLEKAFLETFWQALRKGNIRAAQKVLGFYRERVMGSMIHALGNDDRKQAEECRGKNNLIDALESLGLGVYDKLELQGGLS